MRLFHFTNRQNADHILADKVILSCTAACALHPEKLPAAVASEWDALVDGLIWLTSFPVARQAWQINDLKHQVRFEVEAPAAQRWRTYSIRVGVPRRYRDSLAYKGTLPGTWFVSEEPIPEAQWLSVVSFETLEAVPVL